MPEDVFDSDDSFLYDFALRILTGKQDIASLLGEPFNSPAGVTGST